MCIRDRHITREELALHLALLAVLDVGHQLHGDLYLMDKLLQAPVLDVYKRQIEEKEPENYLNRLDVVEGRLPIQRNECVLVEGNVIDGTGPLSVGNTPVSYTHLQQRSQASARTCPSP